MEAAYEAMKNIDKLIFYVLMKWIWQQATGFRDDYDEKKF